MLLIGLLPHAAAAAGGDSGCGGERGCCFVGAWPDHKYKLRHNLDTKQTVKSGRQRGASSTLREKQNEKKRQFKMASLLAISPGQRGRSKQRCAMATPERLRHIVCKWERCSACPLPLFLLPLLPTASYCLLLLPPPPPLPFVVFIGPLGSASAFHHAHSLN